MASDGSPDMDFGTRTTGRLKTPARQGYSSYAALSMLKDSMQVAPGKRVSDAKQAGGERSTEDLLSPRSPKGEVTLQRTGPSRENALLRAELEVLKQQNSELSSRLAAAESKLGQQHSSQLPHSPSGQQLELDNLKHALSSADAEKASALSVAESAAAQVASISRCLEELLLQPGEVEAVAIACCFLARYWALAAAYELYPEVAPAYAAYWGAVAPPASAVLESASYQQQQQLAAASRQAGYGNKPKPATSTSSTAAPTYAAAGSSSSSSAAAASPSASPSTAAPEPAAAAAADAQCPEWLKARTGRFSLSTQATAADALEVERALRQLQQLGVQAAVLAAMGAQAHSRRATLQLSAADLDGSGLGGNQPPLMAQLSPQEAEEVQFQAAYLAFTWGHAALAGVEPQLAAERAAHWQQRLEQAPCLRDMQELRLAFQELGLLGVEQQLWQSRTTPTGPGRP